MEIHPHYVAAGSCVLLTLLWLAVAIRKKTLDTQRIAQNQESPRKQISLRKVAVLCLAPMLLAALSATAEIWLQTGWLPWAGLLPTGATGAICIGLVLELQGNIRRLNTRQHGCADG